MPALAVTAPGIDAAQVPAALEAAQAASATLAILIHGGAPLARIAAATDTAHAATGMLLAFLARSR